MSITTWALARNHVDEKQKYILLSYLNDEIDTFNSGSGLSADYEVPYPMQNVVGVDSIRLSQAGNAIEFPAVTVYEVGSNNDVSSIVDSQDDVVTYELVAAVASDAGNIAWAATTAKYLALCALTVMERNLPDSPGVVTPRCAVYRVDPVSTAQSRTVPIKDGHLYMSAFSVRFDVYTRVLINYQPAFLPPTLVLDPWVDAVFDPIDATPAIETDTAVPLAVAADANRSTQCTLTAAQLAAASTIDYDLSSFTSPDGYEVYVVNQNTFENTTISVAGNTFSIPISSISISNGDQWIVTVKVNEYNTPLTYPMAWAVTA